MDINFSYININVPVESLPDKLPNSNSEVHCQFPVIFIMMNWQKSAHGANRIFHVAPT